MLQQRNRRYSLPLLSTLMMILFLCLWVQPVAAAPSPSGQTYYVSPQGKDSNTGTTIDQPLQTVQACSQKLTPGDTCTLLNGTYHETIRPPQSGRYDAPITYNVYPGQQTTVDGADPVANWSQVTSSDLATLATNDPYIQNSGFAQAVTAGNIYQTHVPVAPGLFGNQVFVNGKMATEARWPYPGANLLSPQFAQAGPGSDHDHIVDPALTQPAGFWNGATIYLTYWFVTKTMTVTNYQPGQVTFTGNFNCENVNPATRYYLSGKIEVLDHPGEWFYDTATQTLYLWTPDSTSPTANTVEIKQRQNAFDLSGRSYINIKGINLFGSNIITDSVSNHDKIDGIHANYLSHFTDIPVPTNLTENDECNVIVAHETDTGIVLAGQHDVLKNSVLEDSAGDGVAMLGSFNTVSNNIIRNVDYAGTYAAGIYVQGHDQLIIHNTISGAGRSDISTDWHTNGYVFPNNRITYNDMSYYGTIQTDTGAFYACCKLDLSGTRIDHNWAHDVDQANKPIGTIAGIYLDNGSGHALIDHNVVWRNSVPNVTGVNQAGIALQANSGGNRVYNNTVGTSQLGASIAFTGTSQTGLDNQVVNNILTLPTAYTPSDLDLSHNLQPGVDPLFVDPSRNNYQLLPGSPAIDAGQVIPGITDGYVGAAPDDGAYEYGGTVWHAGSWLQG